MKKLYKVLANNSDHYLVDDGSGSSFKVPKRGLSKGVQNQIMQHFADGGEVRDTSMDAPADLDFSKLNAKQPLGYEVVPGTLGFQQAPVGPIVLPPTTPHAQAGALPNLVGADGTLQLPGDEVRAPAAATAAPAPIAAAPVKAKDSSGLGEIGKVMGLQASGINGMAKAQAKLGEQEALAQDQYLADIKGLQQRTDQQLADNEHESDQLKNDIATSKIDPNRIWNNASSGQHVMGAIGLILGGMGGRGNSNQAMEVMQKAIDRDIDSQKEDLGNKKTLLNFNMKKYGDIRLAETATRLQLGSALQAQLGAAAARSKGPMAIEQAKMLNGQLQAQMLPMKAQMAQMQVKTQSMNGVPVNGDADKMLMASDPKYAGQRVVVNGMVYKHTGDIKAANEQRIFEARLKPIEDAVKRLDALGPGAAVPYSKEWNQAIAIREGLGPAIAGLRSTTIGSTRINETEVNHAMAQLNDPTSFRQILNGGVKNQEFFKGLHEDADGLRSQNLIGYRGESSVPGVSDGWKK